MTDPRKQCLVCEGTGKILLPVGADEDIRFSTVVHTLVAYVECPDCHGQRTRTKRI